ncbi:MAG: hypothetical protein U1E17_06335 [Geminicoccaceae bacterium]
MGLHGMGRRVGSLGGRLRIRVRPGGGTMLAARIPELRPPSSGGAEGNAAWTALVVDDHPITHVGCRRLLVEVGYERGARGLTAEEACRLAACTSRR